MKAVEFGYWLQGAFEVGYFEELNAEQLTTIKNHLNMVEITEGLKVNDFCSWLKGYLDGIESESLNPSQVSKIGEKLNACFEHAVPSFKPQTPAWAHDILDQQVRC